MEREINRNYYLSSDTMEFEFHPLGDGSCQVFSPQVEARQAASRSHCPVLLSARSRQIWHQKVKVILSRLTFVNLTERNTDELRETLERALGVSLEQAYEFPASVDSMISLTEDIPVTLTGCKSSILFFVRSRRAMQENSVDEWLSRRDAPDFLLELDGMIFRLGEDKPIS